MRSVRVRVAQLVGAVLLVGRFVPGRSGVAGLSVIVTDDCWGQGVYLTQRSANAMARA
jgi:hypothetical protein